MAKKKKNQMVKKSFFPVLTDMGHAGDLKQEQLEIKYNTHPPREPSPSATHTGAKGWACSYCPWQAGAADLHCRSHMGTPGPTDPESPCKAVPCQWPAVLQRKHLSSCTPWAAQGCPRVVGCARTCAIFGVL